MVDRKVVDMLEEYKAEKMEVVEQGVGNYMAEKVCSKEDKFE